MSKELIERLREDGTFLGGNFGKLMHEAADALEAKAAPVAYITGQFAGRCVIEAINRAAVLPTGMALYATPQPATVQGVNQQLLEALEELMYAHTDKAEALAESAIAAARRGEGE